MRSVMQDLDVSGLPASAACALVAVGVWEAQPLVFICGLGSRSLRQGEDRGDAPKWGRYAAGGKDRAK